MVLFMSTITNFLPQKLKKGEAIAAITSKKLNNNIENNIEQDPRELVFTDGECS